MTAPLSTFDLDGVVRRIVPEVFETMLAFPAAPHPWVAAVAGERVSGAVGVGGERVSGSIYLHLPESLARRAAAAMLSLPATETAGAGVVNDVISELTNMVSGGIKSALCDSNWPCAMSTPSVFRGPAFVIEVPPGSIASSFFFDCHGEHLAVEIQLKLG